MTTINTNTAALVAQLQATKSISQLQRSTDRISSGLRVNSAADDAAGLSIANKLTSQIRGISTALKNSADAISLIDTALAGTTEGIKISQRIRELAVQMSNGTYSPEDRVNAQFEINDLILEIDRLSSETSFNNIKLLDGSFSQTMRVGDGLEELLDVTIDNPLSLTGISALNTAVGSSEAILKSLTSGTGVSNFNIPAIATAQITEMSGDITGNSRINLAETNAPTGTSTLEFLPNRPATGQSDFDTPETSEATGSSALDILSTSDVNIKPKENQSGNFIARGRSVLDIASSRTASGSSSLDYLVNSPATETSSITAGVPLTSDAVVADGGASTLNPLQFNNGDFSSSTGSGTNLSNGKQSCSRWMGHLPRADSA
jgi:flagellin